LTFKGAFVSSLWFSEQTVVISKHSINLLFN